MNIKNIPAYCINLDQRTDRWKEAQKQFKELELNVKRFSAVHMAPGWKGCRQSHIDLLMILKNEPYFIIFEDDIVILPYFFEIIEKALQQMPDNWKILFLGANLQQPIQLISENVAQLKNAFCTHAMLFNNTTGFVNQIIEQADSIRKIDIFYRDHIQEPGNAYITNPMIATQADSYSDITRAEQKYNKLMIENFYKNLIR
jgi:glycosyl transferase, family 25